MTQEDFKFLTILKDKWNDTKRTGSRSIITTIDVAKANDIHHKLFGSYIKPCSACFMDAVHSLIIRRDLYEQSIPIQEPIQETIVDEQPNRTNSRSKKKS